MGSLFIYSQYEFPKGLRSVLIYSLCAKDIPITTLVWDVEFIFLDRQLIEIRNWHHMKQPSYGFCIE